MDVGGGVAVAVGVGVKVDVAVGVSKSYVNVPTDRSWRTPSVKVG